MSKVKVRLERNIEARANGLIRARWPRVKIRKMNGFGFRSWPDRAYLFPKGVVIFIEYKRPGEILSRGQQHEIKELKRLGYAVAVCTSPEGAVAACERALRRAR